jgi:hypothetical protein
MTTSGATSLSETESLSTLFYQAIQWLKSNGREAIQSALIGMVLGFAANLLIMVFALEGNDIPAGSPAAGSGKAFLPGCLFWMLASTIVFSLWGYRRAAGRERFKQAIREFPGVVRGMFRTDGEAVRAHLCWGAACGMAGSYFIAPWFGILFATGYAVSLRSLIGRALTALALRLWSQVSRKFFPARPLPGNNSMAVGLLGACLALVAAFFLSAFWMKAAAAAVLGALAFWMARSKPSAPPPLATLWFWALVFLQVAGVDFVRADDGGWREAGSSFPGWIKSEGAWVTTLLSGCGGLASGLGAALGTGIGNVLGGGGCAGVPPRTDPPPLQPSPLMDPDTGKPLPVHQGNYQEGKPGQVWLWGEWMDPAEAEKWIRERHRQLGTRQQEMEAFAADSRAKSDAWLAQKHQEAEDAQTEMIRKQAEEAAATAAQRNLNDHVRHKLESIAAAQETDPALKEEIERLIKKGDAETLRDLYRRQLDRQIKDTQAESADALNAAKNYGRAETVSKWVVAGAKGGLMAVGGPAGMVATGLGIGAISGAEEGAQSAASGDKFPEFVRKSAIGFLGGFKNGALGVYTNNPAMGLGRKMLLQGGADSAETYIRTGNIKQALAAGAISGASEGIGAGIDAMDPGLKREGMSALSSATSAAAQAASQGGDPHEAFLEGMTSHLASKAGAHAGKHVADSSTDFPDPVKLEQRVNDAVADANQGKKVLIPIENQDPLTQKLDGTRHEQVMIDPHTRKIVVDEHGDPVTKPYVNERLALKQLADPQSSRTAKQAPSEIQEAIINTRRDKIYGPPDAATLAVTTKRLEAEGVLQPGDKLKMDTFSTPGKPPSLGADRDGRMIIERPRPDGSVEKIEVPRHQWEKQAYTDFAKHTQALATQNGHRPLAEVAPPDYAHRCNELQHLKGNGWTDKEIEARAWSEAHNQLFTDKTHMEASRDNSDQGSRVVGREVVPSQKPIASVLAAQQGKGTLEDPAGAAQMQVAKVEFYAEHRVPEALAQSQKGIEGYMALRKGYRDQGLEPPPLSLANAKAMEIIARAPVRSDATPEAIANVDQELRALGFRDTRDAMTKIALQHEGLKWSGPVASPSPVLGSGTAASIARPSAPIAPLEEDPPK